MGPDRILIIRHAEEHATLGIDADGRPDEHSLTVRGWQRAGALVPFFGSENPSGLTPGVIFTSAVAPGSESRRPEQTVSPLYARLHKTGSVVYDQRFAKPDTARLMAKVMTHAGTVLIAWEHSRIPACVAALPDPPKVPDEWPSGRYDLVWILDRQATGWAFRQVPQRLLAGDAGE